MDDNGPSLSMDFGIARIQATGGPDDSLEEVAEVFGDQREFLLDNIEDLKRLDFELVDEYRDSDRSEDPVDPDPSRTFG